MRRPAIPITFPDYPPYFWITAIIAALLIGMAKAGFGGGIGVISTPLMALTIPVIEAAALLLPLLIVIDLLTTRYYYRSYDRTSLWILLPGAILGISLGTIFFGVFKDNERALEVGIGVLSIIFLVYQASRTLIYGALEGHRPPKAAGVLLGITAGFTSTLAHAGGPPATIYLLPQKLARQLFVGTTVIFFMVVNLLKLIPYSYLGLLRVGNLTTILILIPIGYLGIRLGLYLNANFTDKWFNRFIYALLLLTSLQLISGQDLTSWLAAP